MVLAGAKTALNIFSGSTMFSPLAPRNIHENPLVPLSQGTASLDNDVNRLESWPEHPAHVDVGQALETSRRAELITYQPILSPQMGGEEQLVIFICKLTPTE